MAARDEREEEREFLAELKARSGQDLAGWMAAITDKAFKDKNETIDWLRAQGFPFARASWLERIHSNGGRPIYLDSLPAPASMAVIEAKPASAPPLPAPPPPATPAPRPQLRIVPTTPETTNEPPRAVERAPAPAASAPADNGKQLEALVAAAKGYRPLYQMLEAMVRSAVPQVVLEPRGGLIVMAAPAAFAVVLPTPSEVRLGLALGARAHDANLVAPRLKGAPESITHMLVLKDARQINMELQSLIATAHAEAGKAGG